MEVSKIGATKEEVSLLQLYARTFANTLKFNYCHKISAASEDYSYSYSIDVVQQNKIHEIECSNAYLRPKFRLSRSSRILINALKQCRKMNSKRSIL